MAKEMNQQSVDFAGLESELDGVLPPRVIHCVILSKLFRWWCPDILANLGFRRESCTNGHSVMRPMNAFVMV